MPLSAPASKITISNHTALYHRPRLEKNFVQVPQVLLLARADLSDGAKLTYEVLLSFDYIDPETNSHKGIVYPSIETLVLLRGKSRSTVYAHLAELERHGLIEVLIGEGIRLYNPPEGDVEQCQYRQDPQLTATANHSVSQRPSCGASGETPEVVEVDSCSTPTFQKSGRVLMEEEENQETKQYQCSEVGESRLVVDKLLKLGFEKYLAREFVRRYGVARIDEQITNLCRALQQDVNVRSFARWLYRAIERDYTFTDAVKPQSVITPRVRRSIGQEKTLANGDVVYELIEYSPAG